MRYLMTFLFCLLAVILPPQAGMAAKGEAVMRTLDKAEPLKIGVLPYLTSTEILRRFQPLADYLEKMLGRPVRIEIARDYAEHVDRIGRGEVDIAFSGPSPYIYLVEKYGRVPLLAATEVNGQMTFRGVIVTRAGSPLKKVSDLRGKDIAFCDPDSTMGFHVPLYMLLEEGLGLKDLKSYEHLVNHENVALGVLMGDFDAGAVKEDVFNKYKERGLEALAYTPGIAVHLFVASKSLPQADVNAIRNALLELNGTPEGIAVYTSIKKGITRLVPADDADYDMLRKVLKTISKEGVKP